MPCTGSTPRLRSSTGSRRSSFAGARLLLVVDRRSRLCPSRRAPRRARATSGAVSLPLDRAAVPLAEARGPVWCPVDRRPLADLARASGATSPGSLAGLASRPRPSGRGYLAAPKAQRGGGSRAQRGAGVGSPSPENSGEQRSGSEPVQSQQLGRTPVSQDEAPPPSGINGLLAYCQVPFGARGGSSLDWPPGTPPRFYSTRTGIIESRSMKRLIHSGSDY